jgi:mono/diheme cytochrome c family protein
MERLGAFGALVLAAGAFGCVDRHDPTGFRLPPGDVQRGRAAFVELRCHTCHVVRGEDFPAPTADPPVPVVLGRQVPHAPTDGYLVTAIINPSHTLAPGYRKELITRGDGSRMPEYGEIITVRQLADLVAYLQWRTEVIRPGVPPVRGAAR